jgi:hypothetical protein
VKLKIVAAAATSRAHLHCQHKKKKKWLPSSRWAVAVGGLVGQRQSEDVVWRSACDQRMTYWELPFIATL